MKEETNMQIWKPTLSLVVLMRMSDEEEGVIRWS